MNVNGPGIWALEPEVDAGAQSASNAIDAALRKDRLEQLRNQCSVMILGGSSKHANQSRHRVASTLCSVMKERNGDKDADAKDEEGGDEDYLKKQVEAKSTCAQGRTVSAASFPTSKKNKESQLKLAAADPAVVIYVVSVDTEGDAGEPQALVKALNKSLAHMCFVGATLGNLKEAAVCLVIANCAALREKVSTFEGEQSSELFSSLQRTFPGVSNSQDILLGVGSELEQALRSMFSPKEVRSVYVPENLIHLDAPAARTVSEQMLDIVSQVQTSRLSAVETADMSSRFENTTKESKQDQPQEQVNKPAPKSVSRQGFLQDPMVQLALFGLAVLVATFFLLKSIQDDPAKEL